MTCARCEGSGVIPLGLDQALRWNGNRTRTCPDCLGMGVAWAKT